MAEIRGWRGVLCFPQVATNTQITAEQYLRMTFEPDAEFVHGEIVLGPPQRPVPDTPPFVAIEILSKDDRHSDLMQKLEECHAWGVAHIWVVDPVAKRFSSYTEMGLQNVSSLSLAKYSFQSQPSDLFRDL